MTLTSPAFADGAPIPDAHTGAGADTAPPLAWTGAPPGTRSFALICDDPDAPSKTWVHWVVWNIPAGTAGLPAAFTGASQGLNDSGDAGYSGPYPPPGKPHRYYFKLYALKASLELPPRATKRDLERAMQGHVLDEARLMGTYQRP